MTIFSQQYSPIIYIDIREDRIYIVFQLNKI